jgi:hypothetical protein
MLLWQLLYVVEGEGKAPKDRKEGFKYTKDNPSIYKIEQFFLNDACSFASSVSYHSSSITTSINSGIRCCK